MIGTRARVMHDGRMVRAMSVPSEWPPNRAEMIAGKLTAAIRGPPEPDTIAEMSEEDVAAFR